MAEQIYAQGPIPAPAKYQVPGSSEIVPVAVQAELDGTNASGPFVPTLIFRSQAGHVIARVPTDTTVAAGGSAEVSWFPGVKHAASGAGATVAWGRVTGAGAPQVITGSAATGNPTLLTWDQFSFGEDGSGVFSFDPLAPTYLQCSVSPQPGYFLAHAFFDHDNNTPSALAFKDVRAGYQDEAPTGIGGGLTSAKSLLSSDDGFPNIPGAKFGWGVTGWFASRGDPTPIGFQVLVYNFNAAGADLNAVPVSFAVSLVAA